MKPGKWVIELPRYLIADEQLLYKIYREISCMVKQSLFGTPKQFERDIIVLCAEEALKVVREVKIGVVKLKYIRTLPQLKLNDVSNDCLDMFFKTSPPGDTWMCRAMLCRVKLLSQDNNLTLVKF